MDVNINVTLLSLNVRGLHKDNKRWSVFQYMRRKRIDVSFLQETYSTEAVQNKWKNEWGGEVLFAHATNRSKGVMILFRPGLDVVIKDTCIDEYGRYIIVNVMLQGTKVTLVNMYAPNAEPEQATFFNNMKMCIDEQKNGNSYVITGGDMNIILDPSLDRKGGNIRYSKQYECVLKSVNSLMSEHDLCDIWRIKNPGIKRYTWRRKNPQIHSRLDMWWISEDLQDSCEEVDVIPSVRSDHSSIILKLRTFDSKQGKGYWKLNNSFLDEAGYVKGITESISGWVDEAAELEKRMVWEYIKYKIREYSIKYGKEKAKDISDRVTMYEEKLKWLDECIDNVIENERKQELENEKQEIEDQLRQIDDYKTEGIILRSKCTWHEKGEKSNNYFLRLISRNKVKVTMNKLSTETGEIITNPSEIRNKQAEFYEDLYKDKVEKSEIEMANYLGKISVPVLEERDRESCEGNITAEECLSAMKTMKSNKSPGNDGLTMEFYKKFWGIIGKYLVEAINLSYEKGMLTPSQRQAVIVLIDKGKDRTKLKNWRPISLLNVDYKIASRVIADRLKQVLPKLISEDQVGYIKGRKVTDNIRNIADLLYHTKLENIPGILINIDFEKAYDSVNWKFMELVLKNKFNFGDSFIRWIKLFYTDILSCISNNGFTSRYFELQRGVRQGDPLSPYLFLLVIEILSSCIRQNKKIKGISVGEKSYGVLQYADDMNGVMADILSAKEFLKVVSEYGQFSGLKLNKEKTEGMWLGKARNCKSQPLGISWPTRPLKVLGVYVSYEEEECNRLNFGEKIAKCEKVLNEWKARNLTIIGRILIIKTFIVSQFLYVSSIICMPEYVANQVNKMIISFIWKGKKSKLSRSIVYKSKANGGLGVPNIKCMISVSNIKWFRRYLNGECNNLLLNEYCKKCGINLSILAQANFDVRDLIKVMKIPSFYTTVLKDWKRYVSTSIPRTCFLWYNSDLELTGKFRLYKDFYNVGIKYVCDLFDEKQNAIPFCEWVKKGLNKGNWLKWFSLIKSIKLSGILTMYTTHKSKDVNFAIGNTELQKCKSNAMYCEIINQEYSNETVIPRIIKHLDMPENISWSQVYSRVFGQKMVSHMVEFEYFFIHDVLVNRYWLHKWKLNDNNLCRLCNRSVENIKHMFWSCPLIQAFWLQFNTHFNNFTSRVEIIDVFLGRDNTSENIVIQYAKKYLYTSAMKEEYPTVKEFLYVLKGPMQIERHISKMSNNVEQWLTRWDKALV